MTDPTEVEENEITAVARSVKATRETLEGKPDPAVTESGKNRWPIRTIGIGVGSAALVAALLYAGRGRGKK